MLSRRTYSVILSLILFACAASFIVFTVLSAISLFGSLGAFTSDSFFQGMISEFSLSAAASFLNTVLWGMLFWRYAAVLVLALMCILLAVFLLARSGRRVHPMPLAVWGGGVLFSSLFAVVFCFLKFFPSVADLGLPAHSWPFGFITAAGQSMLGPALTAVVSLIAGVCVCVFAAALYRHIRAGTLQPFPDHAPRPAPAPKASQVADQLGSAEDALHKLQSLKESGLITDGEYEQKRSDIIRRM